MFCFKERSEQTNLRDNFDLQTTTIFIIFDEAFVFEIQKIIKSNLNHQETSYKKYLSKSRIRNFVIRSTIKFSTSLLESSFLFENQLEQISIDHNKTIFLYCLDDSFNIESKNHSNFHQHSILQSFILFEKQFENVIVDFNKTISFFSFCDEFNINFSKSHIENYDFRNLVITSKIFDWNLISRLNSNHLSASRVFQNFY